MARATTADGGEETETDTEIKTLRDLGGRHGDAVVRQYGADGHLYAYRDGDEHVVVSRGSDRGDRWDKRVPAERTNVEEGEHLWTIPENWERELGVKRVNGGLDVIYRVPETGAFVRVSTSKNNHLVDAWFGVKSVGDTLAWDLRDEPDADALDEAIERFDDRHPELADALVAVRGQFDAFVAAYREDVEHAIPFLRDEWDAEHYSLPVEKHKFEYVWFEGVDFARVFEEAGIEFDADIRTDVARTLGQEGVATHYPGFTPRVE